MTLSNRVRFGLLGLACGIVCCMTPMERREKERDLFLIGFIGFTGFAVIKEEK